MSAPDIAAFPHTFTGPMGGTHTNYGMSLRDWFAGQALSGQLAGEKGHLPEMITIDAYARDSYRIADAMLAERAKATPAIDALEDGA